MTVPVKTVGETSEAIGNRTQRDTMQSWSFDGKHWRFIWSYGRRIHKTCGVSRVDTAVAKPILENSSVAQGFN